MAPIMFSGRKEIDIEQTDYEQKVDKLNIEFSGITGMNVIMFYLDY